MRIKLCQLVLALVLLINLNPSRATAAQLKVPLEGAQTVTLAGPNKIEEAVFAFSNTLIVNQEINDNLIAAANTVIISKPIDQDVFIAAGTVDIQARIKGEVFILADTVRVSGEGQIDQNLYLSARLIEIDRSKVTGQIFKHSYDRSQNQTTGRNLALKIIISILAALLSFMILVKILPRVENEFNQILAENWKTGIIWGLLILITTPLIALTLIISIVGTPVGLTLLALYLIESYIGPILVGSYLGKTIFSKKTEHFYASLIGVTLLGAVTALPIIGSWVRLVSMIFGLGTLGQTKLKLYRQSH